MGIDKPILEYRYINLCKAYPRLRRVQSQDKKQQPVRFAPESG